jgi:O-antigen ligase
LGGYFTQPETIKIKELLEPTRLVFGLFFLSFLGRSLIRNRRLLTLDRTELWMLVFLVVVLVNVLLLSKRFAFSARIAVDAFVIPFLAYFTVRRLVLDENRLQLFIRVMAYLSCFLIVICLVERFAHPTLLHRVQGPFKSRDYLYVVLMVIFFSLAVEAFLEWSKRRHTVLPRWLQFFVLIGNPIVIGLTLTRGNWIGFLAGLWVFGLLGHRLLVRRQKLAMAGLIVGLIPIGLIAAQELLQTSVIGGRATNFETVETRLRTYTLVLEAARKSPVGGIGLNNLRDYLRDQSRYVDGKVLGTAHNSYLAIIAELGILALVTYLGIMWSIYRASLRIFRVEQNPAARWRGMAAMAMLTAYLVPGLFTHLVYGQLFAHIYIFAFLGAIFGRYGSLMVSTAHASEPVTITGPISYGRIAGKW